MMIDVFKMHQQLRLIKKKNGKNRQRIIRLYPFIIEYNWYGINFQSEKDDLVFNKLIQ